MPSQIELTLGELARIALGTTSLGPANIAVLHSLIDLLLKKLDCREEKVSIGGYESSCLQKLLKSTTIPSYVFQEDKLEILTEKFERINALEQRVESLQNRLEKHFEEIRECNKQGIGGIFDYSNWEHYAGACEDLCVACEPENNLACQLIKNADFMKKMLRRISYPLVDRMFNFESKVEMLHNDFTKFMEKTSEHYMKMALVERCIQEIEHLRHQVDDHHLQFLGAMEEVQDMFDAKLDKIHLPALKKYVRDRFDGIESMLNTLRTKAACPKGGGMIMDGITCLSCGNEKVCTEKTVLIKGILPDAHLRTTAKVSKRYCGCRYQSSAKDLKVARLELSMNPSCVHMVDFKPPVNRAKSCRSAENDYVLKEGRDRMLYRMVLDDKSGNQQLDRIKEAKEEVEVNESKL